MQEIEIRVNGETRTIGGAWNIEELLRSLELHPRMIVVEHNGEILRHEAYPEVQLAPGDSLELVHFVGGG